jgi:uncharacterized membrane protein
MVKEESFSSRPALIAFAGALALMLALSAYAWLALPPGAQVPTHWNFRGEADQYSSKTTGLLLLPGIVGVLVPFILLVTRLDPRRAHVAQSQKFLNAVIGALLLMMLGIHAAMIAIALGHPVPMTTVTMALTGVLFVVIGNYSGKVRSNFFMGVRTPWTLSSELSWNKTNRLFGRMFMLIGAVTFVLAFIADGLAILFLLTGTVLSVPAAVMYSFHVWKHDPAREGGAKKP